jgi:hypothetical protein
MIKVFTVIVMLCLFSSAFAQKDIIVERLEKQAVEIDSLKKLIKAEMDNSKLLRNENNSLQDSLKKLRYDLSNFEVFINGKKNLDSILRQKTDSIFLLQARISERDKQIIIEKQTAELKAKEENEKGKNEILINIINGYKSHSFDVLLKSSTKQSVEQDLQLCQGIPEVRLILSDMQKIFIAKEILDFKPEESQIKSQQIELGQIKRESVILGKLKEILSNYQTFNGGLKEIIGKIVALDNVETVFKQPKEIQKKKYDKILAEISSYIFNYDFNFSDYPYLTDIILEIIKRKLPNADADISDLLKKL